MTTATEYREGVLSVLYATPEELAWYERNFGTRGGDDSFYAQGVYDALNGESYWAI